MCRQLDVFTIVYRGIRVDHHGLDDLRYSTETAENAVWFSFVNNIRF